MKNNTSGMRAAVKWTSALLATTALTGVVPAQAQDTKPAEKKQIEKVVVTAQKRSQLLQDVPASVQVLSTKKLEELQISDINDYSKFLPSVTIQPTSPGFVGIYIRGVASGENRNHSGPMPSVGTYVDEIPITTIQGALDVHVYDIARVEALAGPQGTLYGANSQSGTIRIITNKPDPSEFAAAYNAEVNAVDHGSIGGGVEGYVNVPMGENVAIRIVGWAQHDAGFIDNKPGSRLYPFSGVTDNNFDIAEDDYNDVDTYGARAALRIDLDDNWTVTPAIMAQDEKTNGVFFYDPAVGDLAVTHWFPENSHDRWALASLTIEGQISNFDVTYAGGYLDRTVDGNLDYADYGFFYDTVLGYGGYFTSDGGDPPRDVPPGAAGTPILPTQRIIARDGYAKESHEFRIASPVEARFRVLAGVFYQRQVHDIYQRYIMEDFFPGHSLTTLPDTIWLTSQKRIDVDKAVFGEASYDLTPKLTGTVGLRRYKSENSLEGFFGFSAAFTEFYGYDISTPEAAAETPGAAACFSPIPITPDAPCTNINKLTEEDGETYRFNLAYKIDDDHMVYATHSTGYRPGGVNRRGSLAPYSSDVLTNYEVGWKTTVLDGALRFNGAFFFEQWDDFQFSFLGANGLTQIQNAGEATVTGIESDIAWAVSDAFTVTASASIIHTDFAGSSDFPPAVSELPVTPDFKANVVGRYVFDFYGWEGYFQGAVIYASDAGVDLRFDEAAIIGRLPSHTLVDLSTGFDAVGWTFDIYLNNAFDDRAPLVRTTECAIATCGGQPYDTPTQPRTLGVRFGQRF